MANERRIDTVLGGVARSVGGQQQDINTLERRRLEHERRTQPPPKRSFDELLAEGAAVQDRQQGRRGQDEQPEDGKSADAGPAEPAQGPAASRAQAPAPSQPARTPRAEPAKGPTLPKGRGRLIRG